LNYARKGAFGSLRHRLGTVIVALFT